MKIITKDPLQKAHDELENKFREQIEELTRVNEKLKLEIIDLKQAEPELQSIQEYLDIILFNIPVGVAILEGPEFRYFRINQVLADLNGLSVEEHLGRRLEDVLPKAALGILPNLRRVFENGEAILAREFSVRLPSNPGNEVNLVDWHFPIRVDGRIKAVCAIVMDITERKRSEKEIEKQREQLEKANQELIDYHKNLEKIVENRTTKLREEIIERKQVEDKLRKSESSLASAQRIAHLGSWEWNIPENKTIWSDEVFRIFGFAPQQFEVTYESFLDRIHPNDRSFVEEAVNRVLADSETGYNIQHRIIRPNGTERIVHERGEVKLGEDGKPARMTGTMQDLTEFKNIEAETRQLRDELAHLNRLGIIENMASAIAHEINQPLTAILSNSQAALRLLNINPPDLNEVREALTDIADADKRAGEVIRRIRTMVKKEGFHRELYNINTLIGEVIDLVQNEVVIQNISLTTNLEPRVPGIYGDKIQMQQVILNLIMNALDAVKNQPIDARHIDIATKVEDKEDVEVRVTDSGPGVDEDNIENIFNPFYTTKSHGMGLGLSVCHSIIENHGGRIWVENCSGGGAKFSFRLPFKMDDDL